LCLCRAISVTTDGEPLDPIMHEEGSEHEQHVTTDGEPLDPIMHEEGSEHEQHVTTDGEPLDPIMHEEGSEHDQHFNDGILSQFEQIEAPLGGFNPELAEFNPSEFDENNIHGLEKEHLSLFTDEQLQQLPPDAFQGFSEDQINHLNPEAIQQLTEEQLDKLPPEAIQGITKEHIQNIDPALLQTFDKEQFENMSPNAFSGLSLEQVNNLPAETFNQLPPQNIAEFIVNLENEDIQPDNLKQFLPEGWLLDDDGDLIAPLDAKIALPTKKDIKGNLAEGVSMPEELPDFNKGFGLNGHGDSALSGLQQGLENHGISDFTFEQNKDGIINVTGKDAAEGQSFSFIPNTQELTQGEASNSGLSQNEQGFFLVTMPNGEIVPMIPSPKDSEQLIKSINSSDENNQGNIRVGQSGDVLIKDPASNIETTGIFNPAIEQAPSDLTPGLHKIENADGNSEGIIVYEDGTAQKFSPTIPEPNDFIKSGLKIDGVEKIDYQSDGTLIVIFQGEKYKLTPQFETTKIEIKPSEQTFEPIIQITETGEILYTADINGELITSTLDLTPIE